VSTATHKNFPAATNHAIVPPAKPDRRIRRKWMSRRSGQDGYIEMKGRAFYVRFRLDIDWTFQDSFFPEAGLIYASDFARV
jgi:hypothetical protein